MENMLRQAELTGALTDLLMGIIIIPMIILLFKKQTDKKKQKRMWIYFFITLCISCFLGFTVHYFCENSNLIKRILWIPLLALLFEVFNCFYLVALSIFSDGDKPEKKDIITIHLISLTAYLVTQVLYYTYNLDIIRSFTVFDTVIALISFTLIIIKSCKKGHIGERILFCALLPMLPAGYFQIKRNTLVKMVWYFDHNGLTHLLVILSVLILFFAVIKRILMY